MFRNFLTTNSPLTHLNVEWLQKLGGLIRVVVFDSDANSSKAFVIVYHEQKNQYEATAFDIYSGKIYWTKGVINGGYGAPVIVDGLMILPTKFSNIIALSTDDGHEVWQIETNCRVRSSLNVKESKVYFSSGGTIFELNASDGHITNQWHFKRAFFYGSVDIFDELIITLGAISDENEDSVIMVFAFHKKTGLVYSLPICKSAIISADTVGISWKNGIGFVGGDNLILSFRASDGKVLWISQVDGFAGRQVCSFDNTRVYYTTQSGVVGALNIENGAPVWHIHTNDKTIASPISIYNNHLMLLADAHLNVLESDCGRLAHKIPVGHSPYSMVSFKGDYGLLGAGEPPHNGILFAFKLSETHIQEKYECVVNASNAFIESPFVDILIHIFNADQNLKSAELDGSLFQLSEPIAGKRINISTFAFRIPLPRTICSGDFVFPLFLNMFSGERFVKPVCISLKRKNPLPTRGYLNHIPDITQEKPNYSGAAIGATIRNLYGEHVKQSDIREMIDFVRNHSGYEPFQTWRILLRRVLTSSANKKDQLSEYNRLTAKNSE